MMASYYQQFRAMMIRVMVLGFLLSHCVSGEKGPNYSFMHEATTAPSVSFYDYIVVGGGTAGIPLATTLSEKYNVLLLERGGSPYGNPNITTIQGFAIPLADLTPSSPSQRFISEEGVINSRGRVLGGGTSINSGFYSRAPVSYVEEAGWDGKLVNESYKWIEDKIIHTPVLREWQAGFLNGLLEVGVLPYNNVTLDHVVGTKIGGTLFDSNGTRHTSADILEYANPKRLTVLLQANVEKVLFATKGKSEPITRGVLFRDSEGKLHRAYLKSRKSEVIIMAGSLGSPQILLLSGIGPEDHLKSLNISVVLNQPNVGQYMKDNPMNLVFLESPFPVQASLVGVAGVTRAGTYIEATVGTHLNDLFAPISDDQRSRQGVFMEKFDGPASSGHLELRNTDPTDNPLVTFNYFQDPDDLRRCVIGMQETIQVIESRAFSRFRLPNLTVTDLLNNVQHTPLNFVRNRSDNYTSLEQFCRDNVLSIFHYHGGCTVGKVVDEDYKVIGVKSLRVVDGSTFDGSPGTNPQATLLMLGRYVGVMIQRERKGNH